MGGGIEGGRPAGREEGSGPEGVGELVFEGGAEDGSGEPVESPGKERDYSEKERSIVRHEGMEVNNW